MWALEVIEFVPESMIGSKALAILLLLRQYQSLASYINSLAAICEAMRFMLLFKNKEYIKSPQIQW